MRKKFNNDFKQTIVDLYNSGKSANDLSREYGVSKPTIYLWINDLSPKTTIISHRIPQPFYFFLNK